MSRYHRRINVKEHLRSQEMLRKVAEIRRTSSASIPLLQDQPNEGLTEAEEKRLFTEFHNEQRNDLHFRLGWPWEDLPTAATAWKAQQALLTGEPYVHIKRRQD